MKLLYTTLSVAVLLIACGPKDSDKKDNADTLALDSAKQAQILKDSIKGESDEVIMGAHGNEPFWTLTITQSLIKFKLADKDTVTASDYKTDTSKPGVTTYIGGKDFGVTVEDKPCKDGMNDLTYAKTVTITFQGKKYNGCGGDELATPGNTITKPAKTDNPPKTDVVTPPAKNEHITINGKWTLTILNGKKVTDKEFTNGLATLDINTVDNTGTGFGGCNRFNGSLTIFDGKKIKIEKLISTKMFCEGVPENEYMTVLRSATNFSVVDGKLQLKNDSNKVLAVFVRGVK